MTRPTDDDQHPALPRHTTDAEIGAAMTEQVAMLKSADALIHHLHHSSVVDNVDRQTIADIVAMMRACKGGASPDARQEAWRAGIEAAATYVASMDSSMDSTFELYHTIHIASDQCASVAENREQALKILAEIAAAIRALAEKGPDQ